ncbi:LOW QUALITY PROTEIN: hypothetical protein KUTeg_022966 [Tegillarca granosa]|uniref:Uncharacterized protein n=1 Tax=Tegillarca granosa TaxID=220873 RepID=A0ABQ9E3D0_TEGGR|nr:LOW QUALITY PROTEIN: hypothetical protein KUTeg_022966 [Tegillarca granosa]
MILKQYYTIIFSSFFCYFDCNFLHFSIEKYICILENYKNIKNCIKNMMMFFGLFNQLNIKILNIKK